MDLQYHSSQVENKKDSYNEFDTMDFKMSFLNRKLNGGNIRIVGEAPVSGNTVLATTVKYDGFLGSHCFIDEITTSCDKIGQLENIDNYGRFLSSKAKAYLSKEDLFNSSHVCENRVPDSILASKLLKGLVDVGAQAGDGGNTVVPRTKNLDFALKIDNCLNNMIGDNLLPYDVTGDIMVSIKASRVIKALYGSSTIGSDINYALTNLRLVYTTVADDGKRSKYAMRVKQSIKQSLQSSNASISTKGPVVCDSFWMTFIKKSSENSNLHNSFENQRPPNMQKVEVLWNDSFSKQFTYEIDNEEEILTNYIKAVSSVVGDNSASLQQLASNDSYGVGVAFGSIIDLSKQKLSINLQSGIQSSDPYSAYLFFSGLLALN
jgi:hypothetical protein